VRRPQLRASTWIVARIVPGYRNVEDPGVRARIGLLEGWLSVVLNTLLFFFKGALGLATGSVALIGDALHTLADSFTSVVVIFGFRMAEKPADEKHPFGHGRMEGIAAIVIAVLLAVVALEMGKAAFDRLAHPTISKDIPHWMIWALMGTVLIKELLARFSFDLGEIIDSDALKADGWHHRSDVLATLMVVAAFIGVHWDLTWLDGAMGLGVAVMIAWAAWETISSAIDPLLGQHAPQEMYDEIERIARTVPGVRGVHDILVNRYGTLSIISVHIEVSAAETATRLHEMSDEVETALRHRFAGHAVVHIDPLNTDHPHYDEVKRMVAEALGGEPAVQSFHDLRLVGSDTRFKVVFDIALKPGAGAFSLPELRARLRHRLRERFALARVVIDVEPPYFRNAPALPPSSGV
jgi:cation diffusion facilitator family transporter